MIQSEFKVVFSRKDLAGFLCCISGIMFFIILAWFISDYGIIYTFSVICFFILGFSIVTSMLLFNIKVNGSNIKVRTRLGRKYEFNVSDIEKVFCSRSNSLSKYGSPFCITIIVKSKELKIGCDMLGFEKMVEYILTKFENGEINNRAISKQSQKELLRYKNGEIFKKPTKSKLTLFKKKCSNKTVNKIFGEMEKRGAGWYGTTKITLWKKHLILIFFLYQIQQQLK